MSNDARERFSLDPNRLYTLQQSTAYQNAVQVEAQIRKKELSLQQEYAKTYLDAVNLYNIPGNDSLPANSKSGPLD